MRYLSRLPSPSQGVSNLLGLFEHPARLLPAAWTKTGPIFTVDQLSGGQVDTEDFVVFKGHDGRYYAFVAADVNTAFRHIYLIRGSNLNFDNFEEIGMVLDNPAGNYQDIRIRPRSVVYDEDDERYILYYDVNGTVGGFDVCACTQTKANLTTVPWTQSPNNPLLNDGNSEGFMAFKQWGTYYAFYFRDDGNVRFAHNPDPINDWAWMATIPRKSTLGQTRGLLEVMDGYLLSYEYQPVANWRIGLAFIHKSLEFVTTHQNVPIISPTLPAEGIEVANGFLYRDIGSPVIHLYYNGWTTDVENVFRAHVDLRKAPSWTHGF